MPNISRTIYPLQIALEDFLFDESIKIGLLTVDQLTESKTIVENDSELSLSQYLSSVPGRIVTFSTKSGILGPWKRDLAI